MSAPVPFYRRDSSETILVVDDETFVRDYCSSVLTRSGYEVLVAETGHQALELVKTTQKPIHLALIDIRMPKMSGPELLVELLDWLVPRNLQIRFILMSGYADTRGDPSHSAKRYSFVQKPFTASVLLTAVRGELDSVARLARGNGH